VIRLPQLIGLYRIGGEVLALSAIDDLLSQPVLLEQFRNLDLVVESAHVALRVAAWQKLKAAE
jgi:hypothetical protein